MTVETAKFLVQRGGQQLSVAGSDIQDKCQTGDKFLVYQGNGNPSYADLDYLNSNTDDNLFVVCTDTDGLTYKVKATAVFDTTDVPLPVPPEFKDRVFHCVNWTEASADYPGRSSLSNVLIYHRKREGVGDWDLVSSVPKDELIGCELLVVCIDTEAIYLFAGKGFNFDFGPHTNTTGIEKIASIFANNHLFNGNVAAIDTSNVLELEFVFQSSNNFNQPVSSWDVSNCTKFYGVFEGCLSFNQDLNGWNMSKATNLAQMFYKAKSYNKPLSSWDVSNVTNFYKSFCIAESFNQDISGWNMSKASTIADMFSNTEDFNQDISGWDVSNVRYMAGAFRGSKFNQDISAWDVGAVRDMDKMFKDSIFNQDISNWCVPQITTKPDAFDENANPDFTVDKQPKWGTICRPGSWKDGYLVGHIIHPGGSDYVQVNQALEIICPPGVNVNLNQSYTRLTEAGEYLILFDNPRDTNGDRKGLWGFNGSTSDFTLGPLFDISNSLYLDDLFNGCVLFNDPSVINWDVSHVVEMENLFSNTRTFTQDISGWNTKNCENMFHCFSYATSFNKDLSQWCVPKCNQNQHKSFAINSQLPTIYYPDWGTCPRGEDIP